MKVYNQGQRKFTHHELVFNPGTSTEIPKSHEEAITNLLKSYPNELITDEAANKRTAELANSVTELRSLNAKLNRDIAKLKDAQNGNEDVGTIADLTTKLEAANKTVTDVTLQRNAATDRIRELEKQLSGK
jgi:predicted transglutaminase-like cysteine proteinase